MGHAPGHAPLGGNRRWARPHSDRLLRRLSVGGPAPPGDQQAGDGALPASRELVGLAMAGQSDVADQLRPVPDSLGTSLYFSATTLVPLSYGDIVPIGIPARLATIAESTTGIIIAALALTLLFSL